MPYDDLTGIEYSTFDFGSMLKSSAEVFSGYAGFKNIKIVSDTGGGKLLCADQKKIEWAVNTLLKYSIDNATECGMVGVNSISLSDRIYVNIWFSGNQSRPDGTSARNVESGEDNETSDGPLRHSHDMFDSELSQCRRYIQIHGGNIWIRNDLTRVVRIYLYLPLLTNKSPDFSSRFKPDTMLLKAGILDQPDQPVAL